MRVKELHIKNFRSILDSGVIKLDSYLNTLIGANEAGKTSILMALRTFGTNWEYDDEDLCTFSELWELWQSNEIYKREIEIISIVFDLDEEDKVKLLKINDKLDADILKIIKNFDNSYHIEIEGINLEEVAAQQKWEEIEDIIKNIENELNSFFNNNSNFFTSTEMVDKFDNITGSIIAILKGKSYESINDYFSKLRNLAPDPNHSINEDINKCIQVIDEYLGDINYLEEDTLYLFKDILYLLPNFEYFEDYEELKNSYSFNDFIENKEKYKTLEKLMELTSWDIDNYRSKNSTGKRLELARVSNKLTKMFNGFWDQDRITFEIHIDDEIFVLVKDRLTEMPQMLSMRSQGLRGALSLFVNVMSVPENSIILLDDPGVHLHSSGQKNVLEMMKKISEDRQIFFTTHSPSLIDRNNLNSIKLVFKDTKDGTKIKDKFYTSDYDIFEPIRAAIGLTLNDSLFATKKNLLVEGLSDLFILEAMSKFSSYDGENFIDTSRISIFPTNGAKKMSIYLPFLIKEERDCVCILDYDKEGKEAKKELIDKFDINKEIIVTLNNVSGKDDTDINIEDLIDIEFYFKALNLAYKDIFKAKIGQDSIDINELPEDSFNGIKDYFKSKGLNKPDKILIAKKIHEIAIEKSDSPNEDTISNFSTLFGLINEKI